MALVKIINKLTPLVSDVTGAEPVISPTIITDPFAPIEEYIADGATITAGTLLIPAYNKTQMLQVPLGAYTEFEVTDPKEINYWKNVEVDNAIVEVTSGGGGTTILIEVTITENGTYVASEAGADGYSTVYVDVPNSYTPEDEGKVVEQGTLVSQTELEEPITENGTYDTTTHNSITVDVSGSTGVSGGRDVIFYDYDGATVVTYTAQEFANLSTMPANPSHEGLTAQGWNWTLSDAKLYVAKYGKLNIGQMYVTSDGKTRLYINAYPTPTTDPMTSVGLSLSNNCEVVIDWGDNSEPTHLETTFADYVVKDHIYDTGGEYIVAIEVVSGTIGVSPVESPVFSVELGNNVDGIYFDHCRSLSTISMPAYLPVCGSYEGCSALHYITIPNHITNTDITSRNFAQCYTLTTISLPNEIIRMQDEMFSECYALQSITLPENLHSLPTECFTPCWALSSIVIPSEVTELGMYIFKNCYGLKSITFTSQTPPVQDSDNWLPTSCVIRVPRGTLEAYTTAPYYPSPEDGNAYVEY